MFFRIDPPKDWTGKIPGGNRELPTKPGRTICRVRDHIVWSHDDSLAFYIHNRGGVERPLVGKRTVDSIRTDFHPWSYAGIVVALVDGALRERYQLSEAHKGLMADGHGSLMGLNQRLFDGNLSKEELDSETFLTVTPPEEFLTTYTHRNIHSPQTIGQTLASPDLLYGAIIEDEIQPLLNDLAVQALADKPAKLLPQISYVLTSWPSRDYVDVFCSRTDSKPRSILPAGSIDLGLTSKDYASLADAINFYGNYVARLTEAVGEKDVACLKESLGTVQGSGPFFGVILCDYLKKDPTLIPKDRKVGIFVRQSVRRLVGLAQLCPQITHGGNANITNIIFKIEQLIHKHS